MLWPPAWEHAPWTAPHVLRRTRPTCRATGRELRCVWAWWSHCLAANGGAVTGAAKGGLHDRHVKAQAAAPYRHAAAQPRTLRCAARRPPQIKALATGTGPVACLITKNMAKLPGQLAQEMLKIMQVRPLRSGGREGCRPAAPRRDPAAARRLARLRLACPRWTAPTPAYACLALPRATRASLVKSTLPQCSACRPAPTLSRAFGRRGAAAAGGAGSGGLLVGMAGVGQHQRQRAADLRGGVLHPQPRPR